MSRGVTAICTFFFVQMLAPRRVSAQDSGAASSAAAQAAATITAAELARHVAVLTSDSLHGRATPSLGLEQTAQYLAAEFQRLGLRPGLLSEDEGGGDSTWFQRYPLPGQHRFDYVRSAVLLLEPRGELPEAKGEFTTSARFLTEVGPPIVVETVLNGGTDLFSLDRIKMGSNQTVLVAGRQTAAALASLDLDGKVVIYLPPAGLDSAGQAAVLATLYAKSAGVVVVRAADSSAFAAAAQAASRVPLTLVDGYLRDAAGPQRWPWAVAVWPGVVRAFLAKRGVDLAAVQTDPTPQVRDLPNTAVWLDPKIDSATAATATTVPNVLGLLEGTDSLLRREYVVVMAHMDGAGRAGAGSAEGKAEDRGADDNAVGVAALLALARAWSRPGARPPRSVLFVATSGTGPGQAFWGSNVAASYDRRFGFLAHDRWLVVNLTLDRLGQIRGDSVLIGGQEDVAGGPRADWLAVAHPELGLRVVNRGTAGVPDEEPFAFVRHGVPSFYVRGDRHGAAASPDGSATLNLDAAARVARLVFYLGTELATAKQTPRWSRTEREHLMQLQAP